MMRLTMAVWWSLALVWLLTSQADAESAHAQAARHEEIKGIGPSLEVAKRDALREGVKRLQMELLRQNLDHWRPTENDVQHLLEGPGRAGEIEVINKDLPPSKTWIYPVKIPSDDALRSMDRQALRREVSEQRMSLALRAFAAVAAVLAVIIGCIRADEWTSSRYTALLRAASAALIVAVAVGWWWMQ